MNHIQISLDGACAETHEKMRGIKGIYERALNAMKYIDDEKINLAIAFCPIAFNIDEFPDMVKLVSQFKQKQETLNPFFSKFLFNFSKFIMYLQNLSSINSCHLNQRFVTVC